MTLRECFDRHGCDRGSARHRYDRVYDALPQPARMLEVGVFKGAGIAAWLDYWPDVEVHCIDTFQRVPPHLVPILKHPRVAWWAGDSRYYPSIPGPFDLIIDDGDHRPLSQAETFLNFWPLLQKGGRYFIEDVWPGRPGYDVLLDELAPYDVTHHDLRTPSLPDSYILEIRC